MLKPFKDEFQKDPNLEEDDEDVPYIVKQRKGYLSLGFSMAQTLVLLIMLIQCGLAPFNMNPVSGLRHFGDIVR